MLRSWSTKAIIKTCHVFSMPTFTRWPHKSWANNQQRFGPGHQIRATAFWLSLKYETRKLNFGEKITKSPYTAFLWLNAWFLRPICLKLARSRSSINANLTIGLLDIITHVRAAKLIAISQVMKLWMLWPCNSRNENLTCKYESKKRSERTKK